MRKRNFTWADLPALVEFTNLARQASGDEPTVSLSSLEEHLAQPGLSPEENCFLFEDGHELQAYSDEKQHSVKEICEVMGVSKPTLYKYIQAARTETT